MTEAYISTFWRRGWLVFTICYCPVFKCDIQLTDQQSPTARVQKKLFYLFELNNFQWRTSCCAYVCVF